MRTDVPLHVTCKVQGTIYFRPIPHLFARTNGWIRSRTNDVRDQTYRVLPTTVDVGLGFGVTDRTYVYSTSGTQVTVFY